ncbi:MAG: peptidase M23 [Pedobacter sp.]|nr:MAG: peptidase M23 [Pedobacter sp.]
MRIKRLIILSFLIFMSGLVRAQSMEQLKKSKEALDRQIEQAQKNLKKTESGKKLTLTQINTIRAQVNMMQKKIAVINSEMKGLDNQIAVNAGKVKTLKAQLETLKKEYAGMIRFAQRNKNAYEKLMFVFASHDFNQAYKRIKYLQQFGQYRKKQAEYILGTQKELNEKISVLDKDLKSKSSLLNEQQSEKSKLDKKRNEQNKVLNQLTRQEKQIAQDIKKKKQQQDAINKKIRDEINRIIALERAKEAERARLAAAKAKSENKEEPAAAAKPKTNSELLRSTPEAARLSENFESNRGSLPAPVANGYITQTFGNYKVGTAQNFQEGVIFQTNENAAVRAAFNGTVSMVFTLQGRTNVMIKHGEYFTIYTNLKSASVKVGEKVSTKQTIGVAGLNESVPEVGFQIRKNSTPLNPESWLAR